MGLLNIFKKGKGKDQPEFTKKPGKEKLGQVDTEKKAKKLKENFKQVAEKSAKVQKQEVKPAKDAKAKTKTGLSYSLLIKPVVTEKSAYLGTLSQYVFAVAPNANKITVKKAIQETYGVEPLKVNIVNVSGKDVRYGKSTGRTKDWKKAIITLKPGDKIDVYEGV